MADVLVASGVIFAVLAGWLWVQALYRRFAVAHPELGPFRQDSACGGSCESCGSGDCDAGDPAPAQAPVRVVLQPAGTRDNHDSTGERR